MVESSEFAMGFNRMKMACMVFGVENSNKEVQEQVITWKFVSR